MLTVAYLGPDDLTEEQVLTRLSLERFDTISCDVETVSTEDRTMIGIGIGLGPRESIYFKTFPGPSPYMAIAWNLLLKARTVVLHNAIFDLTTLQEYLITDAPWWGEREQATWGGVGTGGIGESGSGQGSGQGSGAGSGTGWGLAPIWHPTISGRPAVPPLLVQVADRCQDTALMLQVQGLRAGLQSASHNYAQTELDEIANILPERSNMLALDFEVVAHKCLMDCQATLRLWYQQRGPEWGQGGLTWHHELNWEGVAGDPGYGRGDGHVGFDPDEPQDHWVSPAMQECYETDRRLIGLLLKMSARGIKLVGFRVREHYEKISQERLFYQDICTREGFNPGSNQQVGYVLAARGNILPWTKSRKQLKVDDEVLENLTDPLAVVVRQYRSRDKMLGTYFRPCIGKDRVYTWFRQDLSTSRLSSSNINLQNWPDWARDVLLADRSIWTWMDFDQLETRILAVAADEPTLLAAYERGEDAHWTTQQALWPGTAKDDSRYRLLAKTFNHAMDYRAQDFTLAKHTKLPLSVVQPYRQKWLDTYPEIDAWQLETIELAWEHDWVENMFGRRCRVPKPDPGINGVTPNHTEKCAVNYPIQSAAADLVKRAMLHPDVVDMDQALQVHDEILVDGYVEFPEALADLGPLHTPFKTKHGVTWS